SPTWPRMPARPPAPPGCDRPGSPRPRFVLRQIKARCPPPMWLSTPANGPNGDITMTANVPVKAARQAPAQPVLNVFAPLHREIDRLFEDFAPNFPGFRSGLLGAPEARCRMDLAETKAGLEMTIELPGLEEKDIDVSVSDGLLTVSGEKKIESERADKK